MQKIIRENEDMVNRIEELREKKARIFEMGGKEKVDLQHSKGKMTARERIEYFFDSDTFVEVGMHVKSLGKQFGMGERETPADGIITGYGEVSGRKVMVYSTDFTILAGATGEAHGLKMASCFDWAYNMKVPIVGFIDSAGARMHEAVNCMQAYGRVFRAHSIYSGVIPQIVILMGPCAAGQAYSPCLSDFLIMTKGTSMMWLGGPRLTKSATKEDISDVRIGSAEYHMEVSGQCDIVAEDDKDALDKTKTLLSYMPQNWLEKAPTVSNTDPINRKDDFLTHVLPKDNRFAYNMYDIIYSIVDDGEFFDIKKDYAAQLITGFARFNGMPVGILANNPSQLGGVLEPDSSDKFVRFITFCNCFNISVLTIVDTGGFVVGEEWEAKGILRHGSKHLHAYATAMVPKITLVTRKSFAGANMVMGSKTMGADFCFAWPTAEVGLVGPDQAFAVMYHKEIAAAKEDPEKMKEINLKKAEFYDAYINIYTMAGNKRFDVIDDIIEPKETRAILIKAFDFLKTKDAKLPAKKMANRPV